MGAKRKDQLALGGGDGKVHRAGEDLGLKG